MAHPEHVPSSSAQPGTGATPGPLHGHSSEHGHGAGHEGGHGLAKYLYVVLALCLLSTMSFLTYSDLWPASLDTPLVKRLFMLAVSCAKALLVILFFMHLKDEANWKYVLTIPASFMSVLLVAALVPDIGMRVNGAFGVGGKYTRERLEHVGDERDTQIMERASRELEHATAGHTQTGDLHAEPSAESNEVPGE